MRKIDIGRELTEKILAGGFGDRRYCRMLDLTVECDDVESFADRFNMADRPHVVLAYHLRLESGGSGEDASSRLSKDCHQSIIIKLSHDRRANFFGMKPLIERPPEHRVFVRKQHWRTIERFGKAAAVRGGERRRCKERDSAFPQKVAEGADLHSWPYRGVCQHEIQLVLRETDDQPLCLAFMTDHPYRLTQF